MIEKIRKGKGARGLSEYLLASKDHNGDLRPRADIIGGTLAGRTVRELAAEIGMLRRLRPNLQTAVGHASLRVPDGERALSDREWAAIGDRWAAEMGMDSYCTVCHGDHIHLMFSRINSDGSVVSDSHDYRRGEAAVRKIEREFGLVQVEPSHLLEPEKALFHKTAPKKGDFVAMENGEIPARIFVQGALDAVLAKQPTATHLTADMEALGIVIEPNVATTGKLSGFAYHFGDYRFTSASLGRGYTMGNMQKKGFTYEPDRDLEAIRAAKDRAASFLAFGRAGGDTPDASDDAGVGAIAAGDSRPDGIQFGATGQNVQSIGSGARYAEGDHGPLDLKSGGIDRDANGDAGPRPSAEVGAYGAGATSESQGSKSGGKRMDERSEGVTNAKNRYAGADSEAHIAVLDGNGVGGDAGRGLGADDFGEVPLMAWNTRFKQASARKHGKPENERQDVDREAEFERLCAVAHGADLIAYLRGLGLDIKKDGVKDWVVDDRYRITRKQDDHFVWCSWDQSRGGDAIAFCTEELGRTFQQALADLGGGRLSPVTKPHGISHVDRFPTSPPVSRDPDAVLEYLRGRGISQSIIRHAQGAGFLRFVDYQGVPAAAFCGLGDNGRLRSMTLRLTQPIKSWDGEKPITKIDIRYSDKSFPAIWRGGDPNKSVWVVEGGMDALAVMDWYRSHAMAAPDIIVSGGAGVRAFLDRPHVQSILKQSATVYVCLENEKTAETQRRTDSDHEKQIDKICGLGCETVIAWTPPFGSKDIADAWKAGALPDAHDPLAHTRQGGGGGSAPMPTSAPTSTSTFGPE